MDPHANLQEQRSRAVDIDTTCQQVNEVLAESPIDRDRAVELLDSLQDQAGRLAELVAAMDEWRLNGGFDPYLGHLETDDGPLSVLGALRIRKLCNDFRAAQVVFFTFAPDLPARWVQAIVTDQRGHKVVFGIAPDGSAHS